MDWTIEQILGLAPDQFTLRAGRGLADPQKWIALHQDGRTLWGIHPTGRNKSGETAIYLPTYTFTCTCGSRKAPCRHSLGLLQLWQQQADKFSHQTATRSLTNQIKRKQISQQHSAENGRLNQTPHLTQLTTGLYELELWLLDMMRHGLASLPERPKTYWEAMAHRLVDAQAITVAQAVRHLAKLPNSQPNWPEILLQEASRLYLIIQGFRRFETLPVPMQADLQTAVGWLPTNAQNASILTDYWLVLGRQQENNGSHTRHITWLWGQETQTTAQLIDSNHSSTPEGTWLPTNTVWHGPLRFAPSNTPLLATRQGHLQETNIPGIKPVGFDTIRAAAETYSRALAVNPWLPHFPMLLHQTQPTSTEAGWQLKDKTGTQLPLPEKFTHSWHLLALAGAAPSLTMFGVWNGRFLQPLTVFHNGQWQDIHIWRGVP